MQKCKIIDTIIRPYFLLKRIFLHSLDLFIPNKMRRKHVRAYLTFGKIKETINPQPYSHKIAVAFCFDENLWRQATVTILSLLINSPKVSYDIYCITNVSHTHLARIKKIVNQYTKRSTITFLKPNKDFSKSYCGAWSDAIYWRCMLPKLLPNVERIIYADVDTVFTSDLRDADKITMGDNLIAGVYDKPGREYINSGFMIMNLNCMRRRCTYNEMIKWSRNHETQFPDQDMLNAVCAGRIMNISRKFNLQIDGAYDALKTMTLQQRRDLKSPVMLHYAGPQKPWKMEIRKFYSFDIWRRYASMTGLF